ncbi:PREDICTED: SLAM family member 6-like isoform X1 [Bison bison bison]|uniref:SLAM family member 6-like isoform X1 n=2 Tax=Bison bison bison TaxID=43346 RepID=A0A6P3GHB4_BISBB|nr:PREDICTED: SLAM family member 6-like isoform X1 [Bison bison bison]
MGPCSEEPRLCGASRLLGFTSFLLSVCCTGVENSAAPGPGVQDSGLVPLQRIRGGSVLFHVTKNQKADPEEVSWGFGPELNYSVMLRVHRGADTPTWVSLQDKYQQRVHVPNILFLRIDNLTLEDSGQYRARASFTRGIELNQVFLLTVYETVPVPKILVKSASFTPGWCNATLECTAPGDTKDLKVTWEIKDLPRELEQRVTSELPSKSWNLTLYLPVSQPSGSLTCMVSNQVDQKTATLGLGKVCVSDSPGNNDKTLPVIIGTVVIILLICVIGLFLWKTYVKKRKMTTGRGVEVQEDQRDNDGGLHYAELSQQESAAHKGVDKQHLEEKESSTVYSEVCKPEREAMKIL